MQLVLSVFLVLSLSTLLQAARRGHRGSNEVPVRPGRGTRVKTVRVALDPSAPPQIITRSQSASNIANMSLSPWTYRDTYVDSRLPQRISKAQCLTSGCLSLQGGGEDDALEAKPIYYQILVLHRVPRKRQSKKGGKKRYDFMLGTEVITVGCTCVRPSVVPQH